MEPIPALTRRHVVGGMAGIIATTMAGVAPAPAQFGPPTVLAVGAVEFQPHSSDSYVFVAPGGVRATSGNGRFLAGLRLPVGSRILGARVFLNPNGQSRDVFLLRFRPLDLVADVLGSASSTAGFVVESVTLALTTRDVEDNWNYYLSAEIENGGAFLYGARIRYRLLA
jgi:hypothetical protein